MAKSASPIVPPLADQNEVLPLPSRSRAWTIWAIGALFYLSGYYLRVSPAVMTHELMDAFHIGAAGLGTLSGIFFYFYVIMQVPTGVLVDSQGPRRLLIWGGLAAAVGTLLFGLTSSFALACLGRALAGAATALEWLVLLNIGAHWFPTRRFSMLAGLGLFFGNMGALTAQVPLRLMINMFGWRSLLAMSALFLLVLSGLSWWLVRDDPSDLGMKSYARHKSAGGEKARSAELWKGFIHIFRHRNTALVLVIQGGFVGPMIAFTGLWAVPFLTVRFGLSTTASAGVSSVMIVCWAVASPICGDLSDRIGLRKPIYLIGALISTLGWAIMFGTTHLPLWAFIAIAAVTSFSCGAVILGFAYCKEVVSPRYSGASNAIVNIGNMLGPAVLQPAIGWVLDQHWAGKTMGGTRVYSLSALQSGCMPMVAWSCLSLVLLFFTQETYCRQMEPTEG